MKERLATLISGDGTTACSMIEACQSGKVPIDVACVISSSPTAGGIEKAKRLGIDPNDIIVVDPNAYRGSDKKVDQYGFGLTLRNELKARGATIVTQNGWLPFTPDVLIDEYTDAIFNQHPGPVPEFGGKGMYGRRVLAARILFTRTTKRDHWTEAIAQKVRASKLYDEGQVVKSAKVDIFPTDTVFDLQQRLLPVEHQVQIGLLQDIVQGNIHEIPQRKPLVNPGEEEVLVFAKKAAILLYPQG